MSFICDYFNIVRIAFVTLFFCFASHPVSVRASRARMVILIFLSISLVFVVGYFVKSIHIAEYSALVIIYFAASVGRF